MNLMKETHNEIRKAGFEPEQAVYQVNHRRISHGRFMELADRDYDNGFGTQLVLPTLEVILPDGTWLERGEYDGSEWWNHIVPPKTLDTVDDAVDTLFIDDFDYFNRPPFQDDDEEDNQ